LNTVANDQSQVLQAALDYRQRGFSLIFCDRGSKKPLNKSWQHLQKTQPTEVEIRAWDQAWPGANVAIITGAVSGLVVLDVDGPEGIETIKQKHLPPTPCASTGNGFHYYFKHPGFEIRNFVRKAPGLDLRGDGGYVVCPPSIHASGRQYEWCPGLGLDEVDLAEMPEWLVELVREPATSTEASNIDWEQDIVAGGRNDALTKRAGSLLTKMPAAEALTMLLAWNQAHCNPPLANAEVQIIVESIASKEATKPTRKSDTEAFGLTDMGNAKRLVSRHGENIRYCHAWKSWLIWDGTRWKSDENKTIFELAKDTTKHIPEEIKTALDDNDVKAIIGHAKRSESEARLKSMINLAQSEPGIPVASDQLDQDTWLLNCKNGIVDLRSGVLMPHDKGILLTKLAPVDYDQDAKCEIFEAFLGKIMAGNTNLTDFLQRAFGYSLTGDISEHKIFFLYGSGANGKSTLLEAIKNVMGDYAKQTPITTFTLRNNGNDSASNDLAGLKGSRMVSATEAEETHRLAESLVKSVTGGDTVACRFLFKEFFEYAPQFKVFISTNRKPYIAGTDLGIWRRVCLVPFDVSIPEEEQDRKLAEKLRAEQQGILIWLLTGCLRWQRLGLDVPDEVKAATEEYKTEMDWLAGFLDECCVLMAQISCGSTELYDEYVKWAEKNGEKIRSQTKFSVALSEKGLEKGRGGTGRVRWLGIGLKIEEKTEWNDGKVIPINQQDRWG
jgi:putative DNA primase/helicase